MVASKGHAITLSAPNRTLAIKEQSTHRGFEGIAHWLGLQASRFREPDFDRTAEELRPGFRREGKPCQNG